MDASFRKQLSDALKCPEIYVNDDMITVLGYIANGFTWSAEGEQKVLTLAHDFANEIAATRFIANLEDTL